MPALSEQAREALDEATWHAQVAASGFRTLDLVGGYDQCKWRLPLIVDALNRLAEHLGVETVAAVAGSAVTGRHPPEATT